MRLLRLLAALQLPDGVRAKLHVGGLALVVIGGAPLIWCNSREGALVACLGFLVLAYAPGHGVTVERPPPRGQVPR